MPRPERVEINHAQESWDATINDNFALVFDTPLPVARYADFASFPAAAAYEDCIAIAEDEHAAYISDGTDWVRVGVTSFLGLSDTPADYTGQAGKVVAVNAGEDALEFVDPGAGSVGADLRRDWPVNFTDAEQDTGLVWVDGRKIYQKTVTATGPAVPGFAGRTQQAHGVSPDLFVDFFGFGVHGTSGKTIPLPYIEDTTSGNGSLDCYVSNTAVVLLGNTNNYSSYTCYVTMRYVKDEAAAPPLSDKYPSYSTSEQATGMRWVDGRMIYMKSWTDLVGPWTAATSFDHNIANLGDVIKFDALICNPTSARKVPGFADNNTVYRPAWISASSTQITWQTYTTDHRAQDVSHITMFYTKSTDLGDSENVLDGNSYSSKELPSGMAWIDGKPIFRKVLSLGAGLNATSKGYFLSIENLDQVIGMQGTCKRPDGAVFATPLHIYTDGGLRSYRFDLTSKPLTVSRRTSANMSDYGVSEHLIIYYTKVVVDPKDEVWIIREDLTLNVVASGGSAAGDGSLTAPFASIEQAMAWLSDKRITAGSVTIQVGAGTYNHTSPLILDHPDQNRIEILGHVAALTDRDIGGVNGGTKTFTVNGVDCTAEFPAGSLAKVFNSTLNDGIFTVASSSFGGGNTSIVVEEAIRDTTIDGKIYGTGAIDRILSFEDCAGVRVAFTLKMFDGFRVVGNSGGGTTSHGITIDPGATLNMGNNIAVSTFGGAGMSIGMNAVVLAGPIVVAKNTGSGISAIKSAATFVAISENGLACCRNGARGLHAQNSSEITCHRLISTENTSANVELMRSSLFANFCSLHYSGSNGLFIQMKSSAYVYGMKCRHNTTNGSYSMSGSFIYSWGATIRHNGGTGVLSNAASSQHVETPVAVTDNGNNYSPALGAVGNNNSLNFA